MLVGHLETAGPGVRPRRAKSQLPAATPSHAAYARTATTRWPAAIIMTIFTTSTSMRATTVVIARPTLRPTTRRYYILPHNTLHHASCHSESMQPHFTTRNIMSTLVMVYSLQTLLHALGKPNGMMKRLRDAIKN